MAVRNRDFEEETVVRTAGELKALLKDVPDRAVLTYSAPTYELNPDYEDVPADLVRYEPVVVTIVDVTQALEGENGWSVDFRPIERPREA